MTKHTNNYISYYVYDSQLNMIYKLKKDFAMEEKNIPEERKNPTNVPELEEDIHKRDYDIENKPNSPDTEADNSVRNVVEKNMEERRNNQQTNGTNSINVQGTSEQ